MNTGKVANKPTVFPIMQRANPAFLENLGLGVARATGKKSWGSQAFISNDIDELRT